MKKSYSNLCRLLFVCSVFLLSNFYSFTAFGQCNPAANDPSFNINDVGFGNGDGIHTNSSSMAKIHVLPNGKVYLGGRNISYDNDQNQKSIILLDENGNIDYSFQDTTLHLLVEDFEILSNGKVIVVGQYSSENIHRLNSDGSKDYSFNVTGLDVNSNIKEVEIQTDGKIVLAGELLVNGQTRSVIRLEANGTLDNTFIQGTVSGESWSHINDMHTQVDGKILIGGRFSRYNGVLKRAVVRINSDGSLDNSFLGAGTNAYARVMSFAIQTDGKIVVVGDFSSVHYQSSPNLVRLNTNGSLDWTFTSRFSSQSITRHVFIQPNEKIVVTGNFESYGSTSIRNIVRINQDGQVDNSFVPANMPASQVSENGVLSALLPNNKILTGINITNRGIERLNEDGSLDTTFNVNTGSSNSVLKVEKSTLGLFLLGNFGNYNNKRANGIAKILPNGDLDTNFYFNHYTGFSYRDIRTITSQPNGKLLVGGNFNRRRKAQANNILRLNFDGSLDPSFSSDGTFPDSEQISSGTSYTLNDVQKIVLQNDGKILISGWLDEERFLMRLNSDGSIDTTFPTMNISVTEIIIQPDGKILIGGYFTEYRGQTVVGLVRILPNGDIDNTFNTSFLSARITLMDLQNNGDIVVFGTFDGETALKKIHSDGTVDTSFHITFGLDVGFFSVNDIASFQNGKIVVAGQFNQLNNVRTNHLAFIDPDGTIHSISQAGVGADNMINSIVIQSQDTILVAGDFTSYNAIGRNRIARLVSSPPTIPSLSSTNQLGLCPNTQATLSVQTTGTAYWYNSPTSATIIGIGDTLRTSILTSDSTYFYAQDSVVGCGSSQRLEILVTTSQTLNAVSKTNYTVYLDNTGSVDVDAILLDSLSSAGCGNTITSYLFDDTSLSTHSFSCADTNVVHNVILRVTNNQGNTATSPTIIHIKDTISPVVATRLLPVFFNASNQATISARDFITSLSDNCTDSADINVVFNNTGLDSLRLYCGNNSITNFNLRITDRAGNQVIQPVTISLSSTYYDFNVNIFSNTFRSAIPSTVTIFANNYSCVPKSGELKVTLPFNVTYISSSITPTRIVGNNLFWDVTDLSFDRSFVTRIQVLPNVSLNIGDEVCFTGHITPETSDIATRNNLKQYCFPIVNSYDPNDKQVYPQGICTDKFTKRSDLPLTYTIRFQNTGNAPALNVRIADSLSSLLNRRSLRVVGSSHPMVVDTTANNNVINFVFNNINLPDSTSNPEGSQGYVIFELSEIAAHTDTSRISNKSYIYFDTNAPIITNTVKNTIVNTLPNCTVGTPNPPIAACTLPTNLRTEILSSTKIKLLWTTPTGTNAINYEILRNGQRLNTVPASNLSYIDSTLTANTQYNYSIKAICGNNNATSNSVQVRTLPATPVLLSVVAACKGEKGRINVQSAGAVYRVYSSQTGTTPLFETNNASIETPILSDSTTFYISVVINGQESQRLKAVVPIKEVFDAIVEQGSLLESCATEFTLSAQAVEGATYTWFRENVQVGTERTLTTTFEARYKVRVIKNGCSDESAFTTTRFVSAPTAKIQQGNTVSFCGSGTLNAQDTSANVMYEWILNGNVIKTGTSVSVSESGTYTLKASQPSCESSVTVTVTITTAPANVAFTADKTAICPNAETMLSVTTGTGFTYKWFRNNTVISNSSATLSTSEIGTYKVEITTADGCKVMTNETEITRLQVNQAILRVNTESGKDKTIDVTSLDAIESVTWFKDGVEIPAFANQNLITPTETGNYKAKVVYETGCSFETAEKTFTVGGITGIEEESAKIFTIYPNPNNGFFKVEFATTTNQKTTLTLVDALGRIIHSQEIAMNEKSLSITLPKISAGVYVVQIISEGKVYTKQLIIQ